MGIPSCEISIRYGDSAISVAELVETKNGVYIALKIPEVGMHFSFHPPNERHPYPGMFVHVPKLNVSYPIGFPFECLEPENLFEFAYGFAEVIEDGLNQEFDDTPVIVVPESMYNWLVQRMKRICLDPVDLLSGPFIVTEARKLPELLESQKAERLIGLNIENYDEAIIVDKDLSVLSLSLDDLGRLVQIDVAGGSFNQAFNNAFEAIKRMRPDVLEAWLPSSLKNELRISLSAINPILRTY